MNHYYLQMLRRRLKLNTTAKNRGIFERFEREMTPEEIKEARKLVAKVQGAEIRDGELIERRIAGPPDTFQPDIQTP